MNKELIQKRFAKNLATYDENAKIQKVMAEYLIGFLDGKEFKNVLEIGCGTGMLTGLAFKNLIFENYTANDIVSGCEEYIKKISREIKFVPSDIEVFLKNNNDKYDLIISNAVFQWIEDFENFLKLLISRLNKGGTLIFSTFGNKNFTEIREVLGTSLSYRAIEDYEYMLKNFRHVIKEETHTINFKSPAEVLRHIKLTGANAICETKWTKSDMLNFESKYNNWCNNAPILTYNPVYIKIYKD